MAIIYYSILNRWDCHPHSFLSNYGIYSKVYRVWDLDAFIVFFQLYLPLLLQSLWCVSPPCWWCCWVFTTSTNHKTKSTFTRTRCQRNKRTVTDPLSPSLSTLWRYDKPSTCSSNTRHHNVKKLPECWRLSNCHSMHESLWKRKLFFIADRTVQQLHNQLELNNWFKHCRL